MFKKKLVLNVEKKSLKSSLLLNVFFSFSFQTSLECFLQFTLEKSNPIKIANFFRTHEISNRIISIVDKFFSACFQADFQRNRQKRNRFFEDPKILGSGLQSHDQEWWWRDTEYGDLLGMLDGAVTAVQKIILHAANLRKLPKTK